MRFLLTARLDTEKGNELIRSGRMKPLLEQALGDAKPEAVYFAPMAGRRTIFMVLNLTDASELVTKLEPLWLATGAEVDICPAMNGDDLDRGFQALGPNLGKYAS
jgi:hypothetical protein